jgi:hypothetical protein
MTLIEEIRKEATGQVIKELVKSRDWIDDLESRKRLNDLDKMRIDGLVGEALKLKIIEGNERIIALLVELIDRMKLLRDEEKRGEK